MSTTTAAPVIETIVVDAPIERAFEMFTADIGSWWPASHHILQAELAEMVFEPRVGGHIIDRGADGIGVPVGPGPGLRAAAPRRLQLGHHPPLADRDRPGAHQRGRGPLHPRVH